jgi:tRNA-dihydrouridine synthase
LAKFVNLAFLNKKWISFKLKITSMVIPLDQEIAKLKKLYSKKEISLEEFEYQLDKLLEKILSFKKLSSLLSIRIDTLIDSEKITDEQKTLIIGNGDVTSLSQAKEKTQELGLDGYMLGRAIFTNPFLFNPNCEIKDGQIYNQTTQTYLEKKERIELFLEHVLLWQNTWQESKNFAVLKKYSKIYLQGFAGAVDLRTQIASTNNIQELILLLKSFI